MSPTDRDFLIGAVGAFCILCLLVTMGWWPMALFWATTFLPQREDQPWLTKLRDRLTK